MNTKLLLAQPLVSQTNCEVLFIPLGSKEKTTWALSTGKFCLNKQYCPCFV